jgi:lambda family phage tail tape measure protein
MVKLTKSNQDLKMIDDDRRRTQENIIKSIEDQISRSEKLAGIQRNLNDRIKDQQFSISLKGRSPLEQQIANIVENARKSALEAGRSFSEAFTSEDGLTPEKARELADGLDSISKGYQRIADSAIQALGVTNEFAYGNITAIQAIQEQIRSGLITAWDEYKTKATDTAGQIKSSFENFTQGLEDAFVKFVTTGKLSFKDLANSILADLARIALKKAIVGMASLFGFAAGGQVMADTPIIVGERGPELFVPRSAGAIVPNNALGGMAGRSNEGGGGQTAVTYNIQAVDAASFRSLVARDPSFIYAVTEQGRRSQPTRSR